MISDHSMTLACLVLRIVFLEEGAHISNLKFLIEKEALIKGWTRIFSTDLING